MFSQQLKRLVGPALLVGGLLWIAIYVVNVLIGVMTGKSATSLTPGGNMPVLANIGIWFLPFSVLPLGVGLLGVFARLEGRARGLGITGVVFTSIGMVLGSGAIIVLSSIFGTSGYLNGLFGGFGAFATIIGTGFLGWAALRARVLPRWVAWTFIIIGIVTIPILLGTPLSIAPDWATDTVAFLASGISYTVVGVTLVAVRTHADDHTRGVSVNTAAQVK
jgi:hypothetical protein